MNHMLVYFESGMILRKECHFGLNFCIVKRSQELHVTRHCFCADSQNIDCFCCDDCAGDSESKSSKSLIDELKSMIDGCNLGNMSYMDESMDETE